MPRRYDDRDYDRDSQYYGQYNTRSDSEYGRGYSPGSDYGRDSESERYGNEGRFPGDENLGRYSSRRGRGYQSGSGRENYWGRGWENERDESNRESRYGSYGRSGGERGYSEGLTGGYSERYNYPTGRSRESYGDRGRNYDYDRERYDREEGRGWWDRASDAVASWFGDEEAERRRRMDYQREHRGRGPKGYRRSDERIKEDVNDRLSDDYYLDASDVEVAVSNSEVTLTGTVRNRSDKRRAEDIADSVSGVTNVENRLRVKQSGYGYGDAGNAGTSRETPTSSNITGTSGTTASSATAGGRTTGT